MIQLARAVTWMLLVAAVGCGDGSDFLIVPEGGMPVDEGGVALNDGQGGSGGGGSAASGGSGGGGGSTGGAGGGAGGVGGTGGRATGGSGGSSGFDGGIGGRDGSTGLALDCDHLVCDAPAICEDSGAGARCVCPVGYEDVDGDGSRCEDIDECAAGTDDCDTNATCDNATGAFVCSCNAGYEGDGTSCSDIDECADDPCGMGTCSQNAPGQGFECSCSKGQVMVDGVCVCDMGGSFGVRITTDVSWSNIDNVEDGSETTYAWALRTQTYDSDGTLTIETRPCGGTSPDICSTRIPFVKPENEAHAQYFRDSIWDQARMALQVQTVSLPNALPNRPFVLPDAAALLGIDLDDPMGAWPASRGDVGGGGATNGARWVNQDADGSVAVTSFAVAPGTDSAVCPRGSTAARWPYAYWPGLDGATVQRVTRFRVASRIISGMDGTIRSCDRIDGDVTGPDGGQMQSDARVQGCTRVEGNGTAQCEPGLVDFFDGQEQVQQIDAASFVIVRMSGNPTCADVRAADYD